MMPFLAILQLDLRTLVGSWTVRLWLVGTVLLSAVLMLAKWAEFPTALLTASLLYPYLVFPWFLVVTALGINPVSGSRAEALADGILSRPVTRWEYLLATWSARVAVVLGTYLLVILPAIGLLSVLERPVSEDTVSLYGVCAALGVVALVLTFQVSLAFLMGTLLRKPILTIIVLSVLWYSVSGILHAFQLKEFSPISLSQAIPTVLHRPWREAEADAATPSRSREADAEAVARQWANFRNTLSGVPQQRSEPEKKGFFEDKDKVYIDFSLRRVVLGYGIPTLVAVGLATFWFCRRDL